ncbi:hypothetical protein QF117_05405 [Vibrio sp. YMD68]|uniref:hypothetical protein n=1 Tax=Vibrio sp. YMD68 TaxID=3042300 RepID=UPI00249C3626|nr:hypothetical protein [Vibrio sp. YMD68]WGV98296.1 hypothetical protein QF117_05405 [Vibrio sp. YMD68]
MKKKSSIAQRVLAWIGNNGAKEKAIPILAGVSIGDFFVPALPTQTSVMLLAWLQPKRAIWIVFAFATAAAAGAGILTLLATLLEHYLQMATPTAESKVYQQWLTLQGYIQEYGFLALAVMSLFPTPPRTMVVLSLLSGLAWFGILLTVFVGKFVWFSVVVTLITIAPKWLIKLPVVGTRVQTLLAQKSTYEQVR